VCLCVCVRERERQTDRDRDRDREGVVICLPSIEPPPTHTHTLLLTQVDLKVASAVLPVSSGPTTIKVDILVPCCSQSTANQRIGHLKHHFLIQLGMECCPRVEPHRRSGPLGVVECHHHHGSAQQLRQHKRKRHCRIYVRLSFDHHHRNPVGMSSAAAVPLFLQGRGGKGRGRGGRGRGGSSAVPGGLNQTDLGGGVLAASGTLGDDLSSSDEDVDTASVDDETASVDDETTADEVAVAGKAVQAYAAALGDGKCWFRSRYDWVHNEHSPPFHPLPHTHVQSTVCVCQFPPASCKMKRWLRGPAPPICS
jgi:hypothetical protein